MEKLLKVISCFLFFLLIASCHNQNTGDSKQTDLFHQITKSDSGLFRKIELGMTKSEVKQKESATPKEEEEDYLYYEFPTDSNNLYSIAYSFDSTGLTEIQTDIFVGAEEEASNMFNRFKAYYEHKYGQSENETDLLVWTTRSAKYTNIKVSLNDESADYNSGKLSLSFYPDL